MSHEFRFTVFTSCYNSENFIERVYKSLLSQTYKNFEWLVIDDASTDSTRDVISGYVKENLLNIRFIVNRENQMVAKNCHTAVEKARGEFFLFIGHDDELVPEALEVFNNIWENVVPADQKPFLAGMMCNCQDQYGNLVVDRFPGAPCIDGYFEMYFDKNVKGEKLFCYLTDIMKAHPFSTVDRYVPENTVLMAISDTYKTYFFNEELRVYYINQKDHQSLSANKKISYPRGIRFSKLEDLNRRFKKLTRHPALAFKTLANFNRMSVHLRIPLGESVRELCHPVPRMLALFTYPIGLLLAVRDKLNKLI